MEEGRQGRGSEGKGRQGKADGRKEKREASANPHANKPLMEETKLNVYDYKERSQASRSTITENTSG